MLKLETHQASQLQSNSMDQFLTQAIQHLRRELPEHCVGRTDQQLRDRVKSCIQRAQKYGLMGKREIMCFVDVTCLLGEEFDTDSRHPWARALLDSDKLSGRDRANLLLATACSVHRELQTAK
ncbi:hypothetical protein [Cystobacter ferrugineus]|uniref:Uncharacterized protein n=1 Tax=Cystobacter ferrugineus TaxID=83449 RepID=A0A1L9BKG2_9BACT|nr:hypothetical protein [Cystobacter ferrugineus]OJH42804.1 hypothetical protein BON30_06425 [Cystobacter ferrugineus]